MTESARVVVTIPKTKIPWIQVNLAELKLVRSRLQSENPLVRSRLNSEDPSVQSRLQIEDPLVRSRLQPVNSVLCYNVSDAEGEHSEEEEVITNSRVFKYNIVLCKFSVSYSHTGVIAYHHPSNPGALSYRVLAYHVSSILVSSTLDP